PVPWRVVLDEAHRWLGQGIPPGSRPGAWSTLRNRAGRGWERDVVQLGCVVLQHTTPGVVVESGGHSRKVLPRPRVEARWVGHIRLGEHIVDSDVLDERGPTHVLEPERHVDVVAE